MTGIKLFITRAYRHLQRFHLYFSYAILYFLGNGSLLPFHIFQLSLYLISVLLIYLIFLKFFGSKIAFLLSLIFLTHPVNEEIVAYIGDLQDVLFFFFGVSSLYLI